MLGVFDYSVGSATLPATGRIPFFFKVRIACVLRVIVTFWPSTTKVFFCRFGLKTRFVRRKEKLTLWPNCLPLPVNSQRAAISFTLLLLNNLY